MAAAREISKLYEECVRGTVAEVLAHFNEHEPKGEFVLLVGGAPGEKKKKADGKREKADGKREKKAHPQHIDNLNDTAE